MKRAIDVTASLIGLIILSPVLLVIALAIKMDSAGPVLFRQERMGKDFHPFFILKFRTMVEDAPQKGTLITAGNDHRITRIGKNLRRLKLDELPQLLNVLKGEMSLVGPRPEVRKYVEMFKEEYEKILTIPPGITDLASLEYVDEASVLGNATDPEREYTNNILPHKIALAKEYIRQSKTSFDLKLILRTIAKSFLLK